MTNPAIFCTICTESHLHKTLALADSIGKYDGSIDVLVIDQKQLEEKYKKANIRYHFLEELTSPLAKSIIKKYKWYKDKLRWSLKSVFIKEILETSEKVIYVDNDIYFFNDFHFLFDHLDTNDILLTPHHYPSNPESNQNWFEANFRVGLYNAGFLGVNTKAKHVLDWWAKSCLYRCEKNHFRGLYDDQKYLDLIPILHPKTKILDHKGCNVAGWNAINCRISMQGNKAFVNDAFPLIFYHFNPYSMGILDKEGFVFNTYLNALKNYNPQLNANDFDYRESMASRLKLFIWKILNRLNAAR